MSKVTKKNKKRSDKKSKGKKTKASTVADSSEGPDELKNPNFYFGYDAFSLPNGDIYVGEYCAHKIGIVWREGLGIYITKDDHLYEGKWENDQLLSSEETRIYYPDGVEFHGPIRNGKYSGTGVYVLDQKMPVSCQFQDDSPIGEVVMTDHRNHLWKGIASEESVLLLPENHFYVNLSYESGVGAKSVSKTNSIQHQVSINKSSDSISSKELERIVFKRTSKTENDFQDLSKDTNVFHKMGQGLNKTEPEKKESNNLTLLKEFLNKKYMDACEPVMVLYPNADL